MLRSVVFAAAVMIGTFVDTAPASAQSSIDARAAAIRARQNKRPRTDWVEQFRKARAEAERRTQAQRAADAVEIKEKYGAYLARGNEAADILYRISGHNLFIYRNGNDIIQVKDRSVGNSQIQESYSINRNNNPANIANNGIVEHVSIRYSVILKNVSDEFILREFHNGEWLDWREFQAANGDGDWEILSIEIDKMADGSILAKYSPDLQVFYADSIVSHRSNNTSIQMPANCDWSTKFNPHLCLSWPSVRDRAAEEQARIEARRRADLALRAEAEAAERRREAFVRTSAQTAFDNGDYRQSLKLEARLSPSCYNGRSVYVSGQDSPCYNVARSLFYLGQTYREGRGVNRNYTTALAYFYLAKTIHKPYTTEYDRLMELFNDMGTRDPVRFQEADAALNQLVKQCTDSNFQSC